MTDRLPAADARRNRPLYALALLAYSVVAVRELTTRADNGSLMPAALLLGCFFLLFMTDPFLFHRFMWYPYLYFALQTAVVEALGLLPPYQDIWALLYVPLGVQAYYYLPWRWGLAWAGLATTVMIASMMGIMGWAYGLGLGLTYAAAGVLVVSWEVLTAQAEAARRDSQALLAELREAHQLLQDYAAKAEAQAALREHERLAHELHDSVGQIIFSITLTVEAIRILLHKNQAAVPEQLDHLQEMTSVALSQMRSLITQWRPR